METADREWSRVRPRAERSRTTGHRVELGRAERRRLIQLLACLCLFAVCFVGKRVGPEEWSQELLGLMRDGGGVSAVFSRAGEALAGGESLTRTAGELWVQVFGAADVTVGGEHRSALYLRERRALSADLETSDTDYLTRWTELPVGERAETLCVIRTGQLPPEPAPVPEAPAVVHMDYRGPALPDGTTMDRYRLELAETVMPVMGGWLSSAFGWREHPLDGEERFHNGVDLAVNTGTDVRAYAEGTVDYIGESDVYGKYLQLRHADGVTTFYAHCDELLVQKGQQVAAGERVALSGDTGNSTGPHLHFEMKKDGLRLNPLYYIEVG